MDDESSLLLVIDTVEGGRELADGAEHGTEVAVVGMSPMLRQLCARFWPGPQPTPYRDRTAAVDMPSALPV